jgi:hypothetical protein
MTQENLEVWRASIEELRTGTHELDREAWLARMAELWHPQIEFDVSEAPWLGLSGIYLGRDAIRELWREWFGSWETLQFDYELVDSGERVVMLVEWRLRARSSGNELPVWKNAWVSTFKDGRMVHSKLYMSHREALEAVGLRE